MAGALRCSYCRRRLFSVVADHLPARGGFPPHVQLFAFGCPSCRAVVGIELVLIPAEKTHSLASLHDGREAEVGLFARLRCLASEQQPSG